MNHSRDSQIGVQDTVCPVLMDYQHFHDKSGKSHNNAARCIADHGNSIGSFAVFIKTCGFSNADYPLRVQGTGYRGGVMWPASRILLSNFLLTFIIVFVWPSAVVRVLTKHLRSLTYNIIMRRLTPSHLKCLGI